ncbi:MAG: methanogenesis marker 6 protein [Methanobacteriales archaeon]|nr:methanogenesis marker 6 protein [Methanobacteriaceae archaeon]MBC7096526.1 methanogenesis marker 6 protein [Methanobacteriales archaeon]
MLKNSKREIQSMLEKKSQDESTRMVILGPNANLSPAELVHKIHMMGLPLTIKSTCYGALIHGEKELVERAAKEIREFDPNNIFLKERGFPPGDPRRCRAHRGGAREGFHQLEKEFKLLGYVSEALSKPQKVSLHEKKRIDIKTFKKIAEDIMRV